MVQSLWTLLKWLRGRKIESATQSKEGTIKIAVAVEGDNNRVEVQFVREEVYAIASDPACRKAAEGVVKPVRTEGIDVFETRQGKRVVESVTKKDLPTIKVPRAEPTDLAPVPP